jgi:hypothetical protein
MAKQIKKKFDEIIIKTTTISHNWLSIVTILSTTWRLPSSTTSTIPIFALAAEAELEFNYLAIANVRTDAIINDACLSDHGHTFYGPPLVSPRVTTDDLIATDP